MRTATWGVSRHSGVPIRGAAFLLQAALLAGCGSSTTPQPPPDTPLVTATSGAGQTGTVGTALGTALVVTVTNSSGVPLANTAVTFVGSDGATVSDTTTTTNSSGQATANVVLGHVPGTDTVTATAVGAGITALFLETATTGAPASLVVYAGSGQTATHGTQVPTPLSVLVHDQYGNIVLGTTVNWAASAGVLGALTSMADSSGRAQVTYTLPGVTGVDSVTATLAGGTSPVVFTETGN